MLLLEKKPQFFMQVDPPHFFLLDLLVLWAELWIRLSFFTVFASKDRYVLVVNTVPSRIYPCQRT